MSDYCIVVADGTRARFFSLESSDVQGMAPNARLIEQKDLISTEKDVPGREMWSDSIGRRNDPPFAQGSVHGHDDSRERQGAEFQQRFAKEIATEAVRLAQSQQAKHLIIVAETQMMGAVRQELTIPPYPKIAVEEITKDLSKLSPEQLLQHLEREDALSLAKNPGVKN